MHLALLIFATLSSFTLCSLKSPESAAVTSFIEYMAGPRTGGDIKPFCERGSSISTVLDNVKYTCEMNAEERVTKLSLVGVVNSHQYRRHGPFNEGLILDVSSLLKLTSLIELYPISFNVEASTILASLTTLNQKIRSHHKSHL